MAQLQATFDLLVSPATCLQLVADEVLIAIDLRFRQRTSVIATGLFPRLASLVSNGSKESHPSPTRVPYNCHAVEILASLRSAMRAEYAGPLRGVAKASKYLLFVIRTIPAYRPHRLVDLGQQRGDLRGIIDPMGRQRLGDHLTGGLMDPHMQFQVRRLVQPC